MCDVVADRKGGRVKTVRISRATREWVEALCACLFAASVGATLGAVWASEALGLSW